MPDKIKPIDFESTVQLDLSQLNPYSQDSKGDLPVESYGISDTPAEHDVAFNNPNPLAVEISVSDLSAELDDLANEFSFPDAAETKQPKPSAHESTVMLNTPPTPQKPSAPQAPKPEAPKAPTPQAQKTMPKKASPQKSPPTRKPTPAKKPAAKPPAAVSSNALFDLSEDLLEPVKEEKPTPTAKATVTPPVVKKQQATPPPTAKQPISQVESTILKATPAKSNSMFAMMVGIIGLIAGSTGVWMASNANIELASLQHQIQSLKTQLSTHIRISAQRAVQVESPTAIEGQASKPTPDNVVKIPTDTVTKITKKTITPSTPTVKKSVKAPTTSGPWVVIISSHQALKRAEKEQSRLKKMGVQTNIQSSTVKKRVWYRVVSDGYASKKEAYAHVGSLKRNNAVKGAWVTKIKK